jgi:hypothetical protein|tara:strand:+ start:151 stop:924 length:774 start_codon:yes stop_codon:yes gene_type:complete
MPKLNKIWVQAALEMSQVDKSNLDEWLRKIDGSSSNRLRAFINNLCGADNVNYLEIGVYKGATLMSALASNHKTKAVGIENSMYDWRKPNPSIIPEGSPCWPSMIRDLNYNLEKWKTTSGYVADAITIIEDSFQNVDYSKLPTFNICYLDIEQLNAATLDEFFTIVYPNLDKECVLIVSGVTNSIIMEELNKALLRNDDNFTIEYEFLKISSSGSDSRNYWNGIRILGLKRKVKAAVKALVNKKPVVKPAPKTTKEA